METSFPVRLRTARQRRKFSQARLGELCGISPSAISSFENSTRFPSFEKIPRLADALSVTTDYFFGRVFVPTTAGLIVDDLLRKAEPMSRSDLGALKEFVRLLAKRNRKRSGNDEA